MRWIRVAQAVALASAFSVCAWAQDSGKEGEKPAHKPTAGKTDEGAKGGQKHADKDAKGGVKPGQPAPDFTLKGSDGKTYKLADLKDKVVVIEWLNKDCPVCKKLSKPMHETADELAKKGIVWLAIDSTNTRKSADNTEFAKEQKLTYPILEDFDGTVGHAYGARTTPHMFIINKGKVVYTGALIQEKGDRNYVKEAVEAVLAGKEPPVATTEPYGCTVKYKGAE